MTEAGDRCGPQGVTGVFPHQAALSSSRKDWHADQQLCSPYPVLMMKRQFHGLVLHRCPVLGHSAGIYEES